MSDYSQKTSYVWENHYPEGSKWDANITLHPVYKILDDTVARYGDRPAFDFLGKKYSWAEIASLVNAMAAGLQKHGVTKGTHVGLFLPNTPFYLVSYYALMKIGAVAVNLNPLYPLRELKMLIEDSAAEMVITEDLSLLCDKMDEVLEDTPSLKKLILCRFTDALPFPKNLLFRLFKGKEIARVKHPDRVIWFHDLVAGGGKPEIPDIDPENDLALLQYTGGTTGLPKGAMLTHGNVYANVEQARHVFVNSKEGEERMLGVLPFFHVFAMTAVMNLAVRCGFEIIATPRFDLKDTLKIIDKKKPQYFPAVPAIYSAVNNFKDVDQYDLTSLRYCISGGAPLPVEVKKQFEDRTGCVVVEGYGLSEASPVVCVNPLVGVNKAGSIGLPLPDTIVELVSTEDGTTRVAQGERGELCVKGPQVMTGYWNKPDATAEVMKDGFLHTGDVATMDEEGYFFIVDRIKDMIITNGYKVYPRNVEDEIYKHPDVEECIVAGIADERRGEIVKAWVKLKDGASMDEDTLCAFLKDKLSPMEIPKKIEFRDEPLPKTMIGKLSRKDLLEQEGEA